MISYLKKRFHCRHLEQSLVFFTRLIDDHFDHRLCKARHAACSYVGSPVKRDDVPNSIKNLPPPPAVHVTFV